VILAYVLLVFALLFYVADQHVALYAGAGWAAAVGTSWWFLTRRSSRRTSVTDLCPETAESAG
jgi:hypothetical protein